MFANLVLKSPSLSRVAKWVNNELLSKFGARIYAANSLVVYRGWPYRLLYFARLLDSLEGIQGDIVECGVAGGESLAIFAILNKNREGQRHIWGFDSFKGLPTPSREDLNSPNAIAKKGMYAASETGVLSNLKRAGFNKNDIKYQVTLVKGWFSDTMPKYDGSIALLHIDCDLYESTKCVLENLWPKVTVGGIATFDEYQYEEIWPGEKKAIDEYFSCRLENNNVKMHKDRFYNSYYVVKLK